MWTYHQATGSLIRDGEVFAIGVSGHDEGLNNPALQDHHRLGPIPQGYWTMTEFLEHYGTHGPAVIRLVPDPDTETFGRDGFLIHGLSREHPQQSSEGCIAVSPEATRRGVWATGDHRLHVVR